MAEYFEEEYCFAIPPDDWGLFSLDAIIHVTWMHKPGLELPGGYDYFDGSIDLNDIGDTVGDPSNKMQMSVKEPLKEYARYFDMASPLDTGKPTMLLYDESAREYKGLAVFLRPEIVPIELTPGEYVRKALAWHGARNWQLLYCSLEDFKHLHIVDRRQVYDLPLLLPFLFPDDDWSIIETKRAYFDTEFAD